MKKLLFYKFESDEGYEEIGIAESVKSAESAVRHFAFDTECDVDVEETKAGYFVTIKED